jgi:hypothetical protein
MNFTLEQELYIRAFSDRIEKTASHEEAKELLRIVYSDLVLERGQIDRLERKLQSLTILVESLIKKSAIEERSPNE